MPLLLHLFRHVVGLTVEGLRAGARAVLEDEAVLELEAIDEVDRGLKLGVGLAAKTDDEVARHGGPRQLLADSRVHLEILADRVAPLHPRQHRIAAVLGRDMEILADFGKIADGADQLGRHVTGIIRDKLDPVEAVDGVEIVEEIGKACGLPAVVPLVGVDRLANEGDLAAALGDELRGFGKDRRRGTGLLRPADAWHDAERAKLVTPGLRPDECLERRRPHRRIAVRVVALEALCHSVAAAGGAIEADLDPGRAAGEDLLDDPWHAVELPGADDEVDPRGPGANQLLIFLGHAAEDADDQAGAGLLLLPHPTEGRPDLVFGMLADAAGVVEDGIGLGRARRQLPSLAAQRRHDKLAVEDVHLAANGLDPESAMGGGGRHAKIVALDWKSRGNLLPSRSSQTRSSDRPNRGRALNAAAGGGGRG